MHGLPTMGGSPVFRDCVSHVDAAVVTSLRRAGAVIMGKLHLTEGAMAGYHPDFEIPVNPWNSSRWSGVSSSGSGVAVAAGLCFGAIGTDTGGSIRLPAAANGIVGLKPTFGSVSRYGVLPLSPSLDHVGPMARSTRDAAIMFAAIAGEDPRDPATLGYKSRELLGVMTQGVSGLRIGIDVEFAFSGVDVGQRRSIEEALEILRDLGSRIVNVRMPPMKHIPDAWLHVCASEAVNAHKEHYPTRADEYGPYFREFLEVGASVTSKQLSEAHHLRERFRSELSRLLEDVDVLICPAGAAPAFELPNEIQYGSMTSYNKAVDSLLKALDPPRQRPAFFTRAFAFSGHPAICLPSGFTADGVPYSIQWVGRHWGEPTLCRIAYAYEQATDWHTRHPTHYNAL